MKLGVKNVPEALTCDHDTFASEPWQKSSPNSDPASSLGSWGYIQGLTVDDKFKGHAVRLIW